MLKNFSLLILVLVGVTGCSDLVSLNGDPVEEFRAVDGVKLIDANIENPRDKKTYGQYSYTVGPTSRVLVRFLNMTDLVTRIRTNQGPVSLELTLVNPLEKESALEHIQVHPLIRDWSMLATWTRIVPWGGDDGAWLNAGGDFENAKTYLASPQKPTHPNLSPDRNPLRYNTIVPQANESLYFNVTDWYVNYPKGKSQFFGLIIVSEVPFQIYGDQGSQGPKLHYTE